MKCLTCNKELKSGMKVCPNCGTEIYASQNKKMKKEDTYSDKKELDKDKYRTIVLLKDQLDSIRELLDEDEKKEKEVKKVQSSKKKKKEKEDYNTIVLLQNQLDSIRELLDEDEKKEQTKAKKKKEKEVIEKIDSKKNNNKVSMVENKVKNLESDKKNDKFDDIIQYLENDKKNGEVIEEVKPLESVQLPMLAKKNNSNEKIVIETEVKNGKDVSNQKKPVDKKVEENENSTTTPIDRIADALAGEIVDGINSYNNKIDKEIAPDIEKTKEFNLDLEKTVAIKSLGETKELDKFSLIDDINRQIESTNEEAAKREEHFTKGVELKEEYKVQTEKKDENVEILSTRKKVFFFTGIAMLILLFTLIALWVIAEINGKNSGTRVDYIARIDEAMQHYYETEDIDDILYVLEDVKDNKEEIKKIQSKTRSICDSWVLLYLNEKVEDKVSFEKATDKYKGLLEGLYRYAIVKNDINLVRALTEKDYNDLLIQFDNIYSDSTIFYEALELYNEKDYNKAYYMFEQIESTNAYYEKSVTYCNLIISDIIDTLNNDIKKLETNIDLLDNAQKLKIYSEIEQIVIKYNSLYSNINLTQNEEYQEILSKYTSKVSEYTDKVLNETNSQGSVT